VNQFPEVDLDKHRGVSLFASEGSMFPSKTEMNLAKICKFDLFSITNFAFADIAQHLGMEVKLFATCRTDLRGQNIDDYKTAFSNLRETLIHNILEEIKVDERLANKEYTLTFDAELDLSVNI
jgi:hypothetical protein